MPELHLYASPPGTGKTTRCIQLFQEEISAARGGIDSRAFFVLPSREHAERIQNLVLKKGAPGLFNAHILTIHDFASMLLGGRAASHPTGAIRTSIIREILETGARGQVDFKLFDRVKDFRGFHELLADAVKEFRSNLLEIPEFEKLSQPLLKNPGYLAKFRDFSLVLKHYEKELGSLGLREPEDNIQELCVQEETIEKPDLVIFDGFYHFTRAQKFLIERVSKCAGKMIVTLTLPDREAEDSSLFEYPERTRVFLKDLGFKEKGQEFSVNHRTPDEALRHLEKNIFREQPEKFSGKTDSLEIFSASSERSEIEMIAREIKKIYRRRPGHFSDISLIFRTIGSYEKTIRSVFAFYGIPVHIHERAKLIESGPASILYRVLRLISEGWRREDLLYLLKSAFFAEKLPLEEAVEIERAAFRENIQEGREAWARLLQAEGTPERAELSILYLQELEDQLLGARTIRQFTKRIEEFFLNPAVFFDPEEDREAAACLKAILQGARRYYEGSDNRVFEPAGFVKSFQDAIEKALFSKKSHGKNAVQVYDAVMALPKEYKIVFLSGLLEKSFPVAVNEDALFKDRERKVLNARGIVLEERLWRLAGERYFFYMAATRAKEKLYLTHPSYSFDGKPSLPSFFIEEALRCFAPGTVARYQKKPDEFLPDIGEWETAAEADRGLAENLFKRSVSGGPVPLSAEAAGVLGPALRRDSFRRVLAAGAASGQVEIRDPKILARFKKRPSVYSATKLETFAVCAFKFHAERTLSLGDPLEGREEAQMGTLLHGALEIFYTELAAKKDPAHFYLKDLDAMRRRLHEILEQEIAKSPFRNQPLYRQKAYLESMKRVLSDFLEHEKKISGSRQLIPAYFEMSFGKESRGEYDYLKIPSGPKTEILLTGKIDRIDLSKDGKRALVIDYKRSLRHLAKKIEKGMELQLPIYLLAAQRLLKLEVLGAELRILRGSKVEGVYVEGCEEFLKIPESRIQSKKDFEGFLKNIQDQIVSIDRRLHEADISVDPKTCDFCPYGSVCRFEKWKLKYEPS